MEPSIASDFLTSDLGDAAKSRVVKGRDTKEN